LKFQDKTLNQVQGDSFVERFLEDEGYLKMANIGLQFSDRHAELVSASHNSQELKFSG
jgi:hypothetical protein